MKCADWACVWTCISSANGTAFTFVNEYQAEVVSRRIFLVDFSERRGEIESTKEKPDWYCFSCGDALAGSADGVLCQCAGVKGTAPA